MKKSAMLRGAIVIAVLPLFAAACGSDDNDSAATVATAPATAAGAPDTSMADPPAGQPTMSSAEICDGEGLVQAVQGGTAQGTLEGMADDPVATAASNNPVLTTLTAAVQAAGLVDTLNSAEALTVFAPTDCAFAKLDPATLQAALDDPTGLLPQVLGFHGVVGEQLSADQLAAMTEVPTFTGAGLPISADGETITVGGGQAH